MVHFLGRTSGTYYALRNALISKATRTKPEMIVNNKRNLLPNTCDYPKVNYRNHGIQDTENHFGWSNYWEPFFFPLYQHGFYLPVQIDN